jgi:hypothetical protein
MLIKRIKRIVNLYSEAVVIIIFSRVRVQSIEDHLGKIPSLSEDVDPESPDIFYFVCLASSLRISETWATPHMALYPP